MAAQIVAGLIGSVTGGALGTAASLAFGWRNDVGPVAFAFGLIGGITAAALT